LTAGNGADALAVAAEERPDIILLDMMMPEMDGFEVLHRLREDDATAAIPGIFLTGVSERAKVRRALDNGVPYYIVKPFKTHELMHKINQALAAAANATTTTT
jgi:CheY-like chemotaxis protein